MVSTATIAIYLEGTNFPKNKEELIEIAKKHDAPDDVIDTLQNMPGDKFGSMADVWHAVGKIKK